MPPFSGKFPASSSSLISTWQARKPPTPSGIPGRVDPSTETSMQPFQIYPAELGQKENEAIRERRRISRLPSGPTQSQSLPPDTIGLALSGGGVRSATFNL